MQLLLSRPLTSFKTIARMSAWGSASPVVRQAGGVGTRHRPQLATPGQFPTFPLCIQISPKRTFRVGLWGLFLVAVGTAAGAVAQVCNSAARSKMEQGP
jgi:hypothetical protein